METITYKQIRELFLKKRQRAAHKGDFGHVLVIAGSRGMAGAAVLCARGALRAGAGLVTVSVPDELINIIQTSVPEAMCIGRDPETELSEAALKKYTAVAFGPGIGTAAKSYELVLRVLRNYKGRLVMDADALNIMALANRPDKRWCANFPKLSPDTIATPHPGEAARLLGKTTEDVNTNRAGAFAELQEKLGCIVCLKGAGTLVSPNYINTTGNPGMATGGSGDVLAGVLASFLAQGMKPENAALAGIYVHGLAGDIARDTYGERGLIAGDIADHIAFAIKKLEDDPVL